MKLLVFNGSPRMEKSNSQILIENFAKGFMETVGNSLEQFYIMDTKHHDEYVEKFRTADNVLIIFPLYTDAMPGMVKLFIEKLAPLTGKCTGKKLGFMVHSGFPEGIHCRYISRYLEKLTRRLGCKYLGTLAKGGSEGIQMMPSFLSKRVTLPFYRMGQYFGKTGEFDQKLIRKAAHPVLFGVIGRAIFGRMKLIGLVNFYWNYQLKENNAYDRRFDHPYGK